VEGYLKQGLARLGIRLADHAAAVNRLVVYLDELLKWNRKINLVSRTATAEEIIDKHFLDSLTLIPLLQDHAANRPRPLSLLDVGSGAGFPGLVLKAAMPGLAVTLVEPRQKRCFFLKHVSRTLTLAGVDVLQVRLQPGIVHPQLAGQLFDCIASRALTECDAFLQMTACYLHEEGRAVCMGGGAASGETIAGSAAKNNFRVAGHQSWQLPYSGAGRTIWLLAPGKI